MQTNSVIVNDLRFMRGDAQSLTRVLDYAGTKLFIPVYQRNYDWKEDNCKRLLDDLMKLIKGGKKSHFFGSIVTARLSGGDGYSFVIIDGQQRITTVSLLYLAMVNAVKNGDATEERAGRHERIMQTYIIDEYSDDEIKVRLKPTKNDYEAFLRIVENDKENFIEDSTVTQNYRYLYERVKTMNLPIDVLCNAVKKLSIINIFLDDDDDPQLIFESLNSTGLKLTKADMIRNFVLMDLDMKLQESYYTKYWDPIEKNTNSNKTADFFRDYLTVKQNKIPAIDNVYNVFKEYAEERALESLLQDLLKFSKIYKRILTANTNSKKANCILRRLNKLELTVSYPFIMSLLDYYDDAKIDEGELVSVLSCIESFVFRRLICGYPTNALNKIFCTLHGEALKAKGEQNTYSSSIIYLLQTKTRSSVFPKDENFKNDWETKDIYSMQRRSKLYIFDRLENRDSEETTDVYRKLSDGTYSIEHIMPQTLNEEWKKELGVNYMNIHEKWLHTIANLTLTGYNSKYQNRSFEDKKTVEHGFNDSPLRLNQFVKKCDRWTEVEMKERLTKLQELALHLWPYPKSNYIPTVKSTNGHQLSEEYNYTNAKLKQYIFMGTLYHSDGWSDMLFNVLKTLYELDATPLEEIASHRTTPFIDTKLNIKSGKWREIHDSLFLNTNSDTMSKVRLLRTVFSQYDLDEDELTFVLSGDRESNQLF